MFSGTLQRYKTEMQERNETRTRQVCEPKMEERCVNFTLPSFEKVHNCFVTPIFVESRARLAKYLWLTRWTWT